MKNKIKPTEKCQAKFGDKQCEEVATKILGNYGEMYKLCTSHYKRVKKQLELNYQ